MSKFAPHKRSANNPRPTSSTVCQKCLGNGHYTFECKSTRPYVSRPSKTQQLENPKLFKKLREQTKPSVETPEEFKQKSGTANKILEEKEKERQLAIAIAAAADKGVESSEDEKGEERGRSSKRRKKASSRSSSSSSSSSSSDSDSGSDSSPSRSRSRSRSRKRRVPGGIRYSRSLSRTRRSLSRTRSPRSQSP